MTSGYKFLSCGGILSKKNVKKSARQIYKQEVTAKLEAEFKANPEKYKLGAPTDYKPEFCQMLIDHAKEGGSLAAFAGKIAVWPEILADWARRHPDFDLAKKTAYYISLNFWENLGREKVLNKSESESFGPNQNKSYSESLNTGVWIYNMKCRFRKEWTEVQKIKQIIDDKSSLNHIKIAYVPKSKRIKENTDE